MSLKVSITEFGGFPNTNEFSSDAIQKAIETLTTY